MAAPETGALREPFCKHAGSETVAPGTMSNTSAGCSIGILCLYLGIPRLGGRKAAELE